jgi:hypothetical protein
MQSWTAAAPHQGLHHQEGNEKFWRAIEEVAPAKPDRATRRRR